MASWLEKGRPALFEALNAVCDHIDADARAELRAAEETRHDAVSSELESLKARAVGVDRLEEENCKLRAELLQLKQDRRSPETSKSISRPRASVENQDDPPNPSTAGNDAPGDPASTIAPTESDDRADLLKKCYTLQEAKNKIADNYKIMRSAYDGNKKQLREFKGRVKYLERKVKLLEQSAGRTHDPVEPTNAVPEKSVPKPRERPRASSHSSLAPTANDLAETLSFSSDPGPDTEPRPAIDDAPDLPRRSASHTASLTSSGCPSSDSNGSNPTHRGEADNVNLPRLPRTAYSAATVAVKPEPISSDGPVIVDERPVRKRKTHDDSQEPPRRRIKAEDSDSDPVGVSGSAVLPSQSSLDLDEVGTRLSTPRKNKLLATARLESSAPASRAILGGNERAVLVRPDPEDQDRPATRSIVQSSALTPISSNIRIDRPLTTNSVDRPHKRGLAEGIGALAEDGNLYQRAVRRQTKDALPGTPSGLGRLDKLLNTPTTEENPTKIRSTRPAPQSRTLTASTASDFFGPERRELPFGKNSREPPKDNTLSRVNKNHESKVIKPKPKSDGKKNARESATAGEQDRSRAAGGLRSKDRSTLRLDDFKVNPKFNGGSNYAYAEVVRGKDERACLPGCTDLNCCGKQFRDLAIIQAKNSDRSDAGDRKLFEDYLGDNISRMLGMSRDERDELWVEARTWQLANQLGKHRHRYARRSSPPGFWNPEFPNTQEIQAEKAEAERREKQTIQERHREAMRPGGRWVFRDETC